MSADGAQARQSGAPDTLPVSPLTQRATEQVRKRLQAVEQRLLAPPTEGRAEAGLDALVGAIRTVKDQVDQLGARYSLEADDAPQPLGSEANGAAPYEMPPEPWPVRAILALASVAAVLSVVGAAALYAGGPTGPPASSAVGPRVSPPTQPVLPVAAATLPVTQAPPSRPPAVRLRVPVAPEEVTTFPALARRAGAGDSRAQLEMARLSEAGEAGLARDMVAARLWTRRAAERGERVAMHNLALFLMQGEGGPPNVPEAAIWFRRAADLGVVDAQYNLGLLYDAGQGVERNLREAYRWFSVAANAGDGAAREKAVALEAVLKPAERGAIAREAANYQPGAAPRQERAIIIPPATTLAETQALLSRLGYYLGPIDGVPTPALETATAAYARDNLQRATTRP